MYMLSGVSLRIAVAGEECKVTGEYLKERSPFPERAWKWALKFCILNPGEMAYPTVW